MTLTRVALAAGLLLTACGSDPAPLAGPSSTPGSPSPTTTATTGPTAPPTPSSSPSCTPAFVANTLLDTASPTGAPLGMKAVAAGLHPGYDRVVFTLAGSGQPGWRAEYVAAPTSDGSGEPVAVAGASFLQIVIRDVGYPGDTGIPEPTNRRFSPAGAPVVREVVLDTLFEGQHTAFIGVSATLPFRVTRLAGPPRVVVDIRHC